MAAAALLDRYGIRRVEDIQLKDIAFAEGLLIEEQLIEVCS